MVPGGWGIRYGQIRNIRECADFRISPPEGKEIEIHFDREVSAAYSFYYEIWENYHFGFGLPSGKGWKHEPSWVISLIKMFDAVWNEIEAYRAERRRKGWRQ